jgi:hypothetical protein
MDQHFCQTIEVGGKNTGVALLGEAKEETHVWHFEQRSEQWVASVLL